MNSEKKFIIFLSFFEKEKISFYSVSPCRFTKNKFMKSLLALPFCIVSFATISCSQKVNEKDIPATVKTTFSKAYDKPGKVKWNKEGKNEYEASFILNGKDMSVGYSNDGGLQETET